MISQMEKPTKSTYRFAVISVFLDVSSIFPLLLILMGLVLENIFQIKLQWLYDFMRWLGKTRIIVYIGLLSLPGFIIAVIARVRTTTKIEMRIATIGIILGILGVLWTYFYWSISRFGTWDDYIM